MSNSWLNMSQNSTGFMYYEVDPIPTQEELNETPEFMAFSEQIPSPQSRKFNPCNFSSPYHSRRDSPRNFNKRGRAPHGLNPQNSLPFGSKQNSSPFNLNRTFNSNKSFSSNNSFSSNSFTSNFSNSRSRGSNYKSRVDYSNKSSYLHPSFMEDPWAVLEMHLDNKEKQEQGCGSSNGSNLDDHDGSCSSRNQTEI